MSQSENYQLTQEEKEYIESLSGKYKDLYGMYSISDMVWRVDHALADGNATSAELAVRLVYSVLNSQSYFKLVFNEDENNEEWKSRAALRDGLYKLINCDM